MLLLYLFLIKGSDITGDPYCVFDTLANIPGTAKVLNFLDEESKRKAPSLIQNEEIIKRIQMLHKNCTWWDPIISNCEHVLAHVRYGEIDQVLNVSKCKCVWNVYKWMPKLTTLVKMCCI